MITSSPKLRLAHLYPKRMNIYGDRGNIMALTARAAWRGIEVTVDECEVGSKRDLRGYDLIFFGGGQDQQQSTLVADLKSRADDLREALADGAALLAICGGYQLLGRYYQPAEDERLDGIGVFPAYTVAGAKRLIGNVVAQSTMELGQPLVGFENHSGLTWLDDDATPLARVTHGFGNNGKDSTEGCVVGNAIGTYLHGSLLPKNPGLTDWLIGKALTRRYPEYQLAPLESTLETNANRAVAGRFA